MATVVKPPILDPTGQLILSKLTDIKNNLHLPHDVHYGFEYPDRELGKTGDWYIRFRWVEDEEHIGEDYVADIHTIYTKLPVGEIIEDDPFYNPWKSIASNTVIESGTEPPVPDSGEDGNIFILYEVIEDEETGDLSVAIDRIYQKEEGIWGYMEGGVPRSEFDLAISEARYRSLVLYNTNEIVVTSTTSNTYRRFLILERDFVMEHRSPLNFDFSLNMNVICDPYTLNEYTYSIKGDTKIRIIYEIDNVEMNYYPEQVLEDGPNTYSVHYVLSILEKQVHNFKMYLEVMNGTISIAVRNLLGNISGTGIDADGFSGVMVGMDEVPYLTFIHSYATIDDYSEGPEHIPVTAKEPTDNVLRYKFSSMFGSIADALDSIELPIPDPEEEEENND